jgi:uncharacterized protein (TIGR02058 family)
VGFVRVAQPPGAQRPVQAESVRVRPMSARDPNLRRFVVEFGTGVDQHGQDATAACVKAVKDAVMRSCLAGLIEIVRLKDIQDMLVEIEVACPHPEGVNREAILDAIPFGQKRLSVMAGGMRAHGLFQPELGDHTDEAYVANAAVTVWINTSTMLAAWQGDLAGTPVAVHEERERGN